MNTIILVNENKEELDKCEARIRSCQTTIKSIKTRFSVCPKSTDGRKRLILLLAFFKIKMIKTMIRLNETANLIVMISKQIELSFHTETQNQRSEIEILDKHGPILNKELEEHKVTQSNINLQTWKQVVSLDRKVEENDKFVENLKFMDKLDKLYEEKANLSKALEDSVQEKISI